MSPESSPSPLPHPGDLAHLLFSTRQARPTSSTGFNRQVVAASAGVPEPAYREMESLADMTGFVLRKADLPPLWAFRRLGPDLWLLVRAVSLGLYRKGNHQLLAHGLVLRRHHLEWLEGNPFLLATPQARQAGVAFVESHPEGRGELAPLRLDSAFAGVAAGLNLERFHRLSHEIDPAAGEPLPVAPLLDRLLDREHTTAWVAPPHLNPERPDPWFLEWLLLHLHPADRAELSFHGWYAYDSPRRFDLVGVARSDADELRRHLRGEVEVWDAARPGAGMRGPATTPSLGQRMQALRRRDPLRLAQTLDTYYLTLLEPRFRPDLHERNLDVLTPEQAHLCLRHELGEEAGGALSKAETEALHALYLRSGNDLLNNASRLAETWGRGPAAFAARLAHHREVPLQAPARDRELTLGRLRSPVQRWALLALLPLCTPAAGADELRRLWPRLVPPGRFPEILALFDGPQAVALAEEALRPWMEAQVPVAAGGPGNPPPWSLYLRFLHHHGRPDLPAALRFEALLGEADAELRLVGYRELQRFAFDTGSLAFGLEVLFERELPLLPEAARRIRAGDGVARLLETDGRADEVLGPALDDPVVAEATFRTLGRWLAEREAREEEAWRRCRRLLEHQGAPLPAAAVDAAALFLAALAEKGWDVADGLELLGRDAADAVRDRLVAATARQLLDRGLAGRSGRLAADAPVLRGVTLLLDHRNALPGIGETADRALLELLLPTLVLAPAAGAGARLRRAFRTWLDGLLDGDRFPALVDHPREWRHLLLDELLTVEAGERAMEAPHRRSRTGTPRRPRSSAGTRFAEPRFREPAFDEPRFREPRFDDRGFDDGGSQGGGSQGGGSRGGGSRGGGSRGGGSQGGGFQGGRFEAGDPGDGRVDAGGRGSAASGDDGRREGSDRGGGRTGSGGEGGGLRGWWRWWRRSREPAPATGDRTAGAPREGRRPAADRDRDPAHRHPRPTPPDAPPPRPPLDADDPRLRAYLRLAWRRWQEDAEAGHPTGGAELALLRGTAGLAPGDHRRLLAATLPPGHGDAARDRLAAILPGAAGPAASRSTPEGL